MPVQIFLTEATQLKDLTRFLKQSVGGWEIKGPHYINISLGTNPLLVKEAMSLLGEDVYLSFAADIDMKTVKEVMQQLPDGVDIKLDSHTTLTIAKTVIDNIPQRSAIYLSALLDPNVAQSIVRYFRSGLTLGLSRILSLEQAKSLASVLPAGGILRVFTDTPEETLIAAIASLSKGTTLEFEENLSYIRRFEYIISQIPQWVSLNVTSNFSPRSVARMLNAFKPGVGAMLCENLSQTVIDQVTTNLPRGALVRFPKDISLQNAIATTQKLKHGVHLLFNTHHSAELMESIIANMPSSSKIYCPTNMTVEMALIVARKLPKGVLFVLPSHFSFQETMTFMRTLNPGSILEFSFIPVSIRHSTIVSRSLPKDVILSIGSGVPIDVIITLIGALPIGGIFRLERIYSTEELLKIVDVMDRRGVCIPSQEIPIEIKRKLVEKGCEIKDMTILAKYIREGDLSIFHSKRKTEENVDVLAVSPSESKQFKRT